LAQVRPRTAHKASRNEHLRAYESGAGHLGLGSGGEMEWSAASEGVPAALRLSKSTQSADKVHFSDSTRLPGEPETFDRYHHIPVITAHIRACYINSDRFPSQNRHVAAKTGVFCPGKSQGDVTTVITLPARKILPVKAGSSGEFSGRRVPRPAGALRPGFVRLQCLFRRCRTPFRGPPRFGSRAIPP